MSWTVTLEDAIGPIGTSIELHVDASLHDDVINNFLLLKYLDPYGDTKFNHLQMADLILDLNKLQLISDNKDIKVVIEMAAKCKEQLHSYLTFYGD